jgi:hypothetical protein
LPEFKRNGGITRPGAVHGLRFIAIPYLTGKLKNPPKQKRSDAMTGRLKLPTLRIDSEKSIRLTYRGKRFQGFSGDTIATVLYAGGVRVFGRSLKYHRPRGLYSLDGESSNTFMNVNGIPNVCAEKTLARDGMKVKAQNVKGAPGVRCHGLHG